MFSLLPAPPGGVSGCALWLDPLLAALGSLDDTLRARIAIYALPMVMRQDKTALAHLLPRVQGADGAGAVQDVSTWNQAQVSAMLLIADCTVTHVWSRFPKFEQHNVQPCSIGHRKQSDDCSTSAAAIPDVLSMPPYSFAQLATFVTVVKAGLETQVLNAVEDVAVGGVTPAVVEAALQAALSSASESVRCSPATSLQSEFSE